MYDQSLDIADAGLAPDSEQEARFQARIDAGERIEAHDWMPAAYRRSLIRQISRLAHSDTAAILPEGCWVMRAPSLRRKAALLAKLRDQASHGLRLRAIAATLGPSGEPSGDDDAASIFDDPALTWADIGAIGWLVERAASMTRMPLCCYGPYARAMILVCQEASVHQRQGYEMMVAMARGTAEQRAMAQDALDRWWWPSLMMFGPPDAAGARGEFVDTAVPQAEYLGLTVPDPTPHFVAVTGHPAHGASNRERLAARHKARADGAWVREAAAAYAAKHQLHAA